MAHCHLKPDLLLRPLTLRQPSDVLLVSVRRVGHGSQLLLRAALNVQAREVPATVCSLTFSSSQGYGCFFLESPWLELLANGYLACLSSTVEVCDAAKTPISHLDLKSLHYTKIDIYR